MRNNFAQELVEVAKKDKRVFMLAADIGNRLFDPYKEKFPDRFINCGIAEANTIGVAAGMAMSGLRPIAYTITPFITLRCIEQIKIDVALPNLPVIIAGVGCGLSYATLGPTHETLEDIAYLRAMPNMKVVCPGDIKEVRAALNAALKEEGPVYIRLGKKGEPIIHKKPLEFKIGKGIIIQEGNDICILGTGNIMGEVVKAGEILKSQGIKAQLVSYHTVKPLDTELLEEAFKKPVVTVEEHSLIGGFSSAIAEWANDNKKKPFLRIGAKDKFYYEAGTQEHARAYYKIDAQSIAKRILEALK